MMRFLLLFLFTFLVQGEVKYIHKDTLKFFDALHQVEVSGRFGPIEAKEGESFGPYQIGRAYYKDAVEASDGKLNKSYEDVSDIVYAREVVLWYFYRYEKEALENGEFEILSRVHNGGPNWRKKKHLTDKYWQKVKKALTKK